MEKMYKTKDLAEAAALIVKEVPLYGITKEDRICWFIFEDQPSCIKLSNDFYYGTLLINAREYYEAVKRLKNRIFSLV